MDQNQPLASPLHIPTEQEQSEHMSAPPPPLQTSPFTFSKIIITAAIIVIMISIGVTAYLLGSHKQDTASKGVTILYTPTVPLPSNTPTPTPGVLQVTGSQPNGFVKRNFDANTMYTGDAQYHVPATKYPATVASQLQNVPDSELIGIHCSPMYDYTQSGYGYRDDTQGKYVTVSDSSELDRLNKIRVLEESTLHLTRKIETISYCMNTNGSVILSFGAPQDPNVTMGFSAIGHLGISDATISSIQQIPFTKPVYGCGTVLQMTGNQIYYRCDSGEADTTNTQVYKIDINQKTVTTLLDCTLTTSVIAPSPPILNCR